MKKTNILSFFLIFALSFSINARLNALEQYLLTENTLEEIAQKIHRNYEMISLNAITDYLEAQLNYLPTNPSLPYPDQISLTTSNVNNISLEWPESNDLLNFHGSYFSLYSGEQESFYSIEPKLDLHIPNGYYFHIYSLASTGPHQSTQSLVNIFIVDKDVFSTQPPRNQTPSTSNPSTANYNLSNSPNPFVGHTNVRFELSEEASTRLHLYDPQSQTFYSNFWQQNLLGPGLHEVPLDLSHLPQGTYYGILQINQHKVYLPLVQLANY